MRSAKDVILRFGSWVDLTQPLALGVVFYGKFEHCNERYNIFDNLAPYDYREFKRLCHLYHSKIMAARKRKLMTEDDIQNFIFESDSELSETSESSSEYSTTSEELEEELEIENTVSVELQNEFLVQNNETDTTNGKHQDQAMTTNRAAPNQKSRKKVSNGYDNIEWKDDEPTEGLTRLPFSGKPGCSIDILSDDPLHIHELIVADKICQKIATETNTYAEQYLRNNEFATHSRCRENGFLLPTLT